MTPGSSSYDVVVVGGGHNGLVGAAYLARAGLSVLVLERLDRTGGAAVSVEPFAGQPARLSRYSYLVSLMPEQLMADLGLDVRLASRTTASYTPWLRASAPAACWSSAPRASHPGVVPASSPAVTTSTPRGRTSTTPMSG